VGALPIGALDRQVSGTRMQLTSLSFAGFVLVFATLASRIRGSARIWLLLGISLVFAATYFKTLAAAVPFVFFLLLGYLAVWIASLKSQARRVGGLIGALVLAFIWLKQYPFVTFAPKIQWDYTTIGLSYILFRILHVVIEVAAGVLERPGPVKFLIYLVFFPSFLSGPINRFDDFERDLSNPVILDNESAYHALRRLLVGLVKVAVVAECVMMAQSAVSSRILDMSSDASQLGLAIRFILAMPLYLIFLYANFSGYTDIAIAIGRLFGIRLPENFNKPFMANNFQDFWSRWHISLSEWFKIYVFNPLLKALMSRFTSAKAAPYLGVLALFLVFLILGAWHGASWEYLLCGGLLATGVAANKLFQIEMAKRLGKKAYQGLTKQSVYIWGARGLTLAWVSVALVPFWLSVSQMSDFAGRLGVFGLLSVVLAIGLTFALGTFLLARFFQVIERLGIAAQIGSAATGRVVFLGCLLMILAFGIPMINSSTAFVYQGF
jgi:D-alanyl-lipoteichoic acid acyltransferase DltB (MBOAT superfamily)